MIKFIKSDKSTFFFAFLMLLVYFFIVYVNYKAPGEADPLINLGIFLTTTIGFPIIILTIENNHNLTGCPKILTRIFFVGLIVLGLYITTFGDMVLSCGNGSDFECILGKLSLVILFIIASVLIWIEKNRYQKKQRKKVKEDTQKLKNKIIKLLSPSIRQGGFNMDPVIIQGDKSTLLLNANPTINKIITELKKDMINHVIDDYNKKDDEKIVMMKSINNMDRTSILSLYLKEVYAPNSKVIKSLVKQFYQSE